MLSAWFSGSIPFRSPSGLYRSPTKVSKQSFWAPYSSILWVFEVRGVWIQPLVVLDLTPNFNPEPEEGGL